MASRLLSINTQPLATLAPLFLAVVILLAPLAAGYAWVSGGHAGESHAHRHHLLEKLVPYSHHHPAERPPAGDATASGGDGSGWSVILHGVPSIALTAVMAPAFLPELVSYLESATATLLAATIASVILSYHAVLFLVNANRPQTQPNPPDRPPTA